MAKFSVLIPTYNRSHTIKRAVDSVLKQTYRDFNVYVLNDGSTDKTEEVIGEIMRNDSDSKVNYWKWDTNRFKMMARRQLIDISDGDWICHLDSDDEYVPQYLDVVAEAIQKYPDAEIFNFGAVVKHPDGAITYRKTFKPAMVGMGHEHFKSGSIGMGSFVYKRRLHDEIGNYPEHRDITRFARESGIPGYTNDGDPTLGNPVGDDFWLFYKLTRNHMSVPLDVDLYVQNVRTDQPELHDGVNPKIM